MGKSSANVLSYHKMRPRPHKYARFFEENPIPATRGPEISKNYTKTKKSNISFYYYHYYWHQLRGIAMGKAVQRISLI